MSSIPFATWEAFFKAFECSMNTEYYGEEYPEYEEYMDNDGDDVFIIKHLLEHGADAQEGLNGFVEAIIKGARYVCESPMTAKSGMDMFIAAGAKVTSKTTDLIFARTCTDFEDEIQNYNARALLIKVLDLDPTTYVPNWNELEPMYWEDIKPIDDEQRFMYLRYLVEVE